MTVFLPMFVQRNAKVEAGIAGYDVAEYIPSWRQQQNAEEDTEGDSDRGDSGNGDESSDEESLKALKDLFDAGRQHVELVVFRLILPL